MVTRSAPTRGFRHSVAMYTLYSCIIPSVPPRANSMTLSPTAVNCNIIASKTNLLHILLTFFFFFFPPAPQNAEWNASSIGVANQLCFFFFFCKQHLVLLKWDLRHGPLSQRCISMRIHFFFFVFLPAIAGGLKWRSQWLYKKNLIWIALQLNSILIIIINYFRKKKNRHTHAHQQKGVTS